MTLRHERFTYNANPTAVTDGSEVDALSDGYGRLQVVATISGSSGSDLATSAKQDTGNTSIAAINTKVPASVAMADDITNSAATLPVAANLILFDGTTWDRARSGLTTAITSYVGLQDVITVAKYNVTPPALTDTQLVTLQCDVAGNLRSADQFAPQYEDGTNNVAAIMIRPLNSATYCTTLYTYFAHVLTKKFVKASAGNVFTIMATNRNAAIRFLGIHNKASDPAAGEAPLVTFMIPAGSSIAIGSEWFTAAGIRFSTGIGWSLGSTSATFTDDATNTEHEVMITYL